MSKLFYKILSLLLLVVLMAGMLIAAPFPENDSMSMYKKKHLFCESIEGNKIIFVGGSGVLYSINAKLIEGRIKGYRVVNMGLNAGLGLKFNLNEVKHYINSGDIVVVIPEYSNYDGGCLGSVNTLLAMNSFPKAIKVTPWEHLSHLLYDHGLEFIPTKCQSYLNDLILYLTKTSPSMNQNGDIVTKTAKRDISRIAFDVKIAYESDKYKACVDLLRDFNKYCEDRGAMAILSFPAIPTPHYEKNKDEIDSLYRHLLNDANIDILSAPNSTVYPLKYFDDTIYHMDTEGKGVHSLDMLNRIKQLRPELVDSRETIFPTVP